MTKSTAKYISRKYGLAFRKPKYRETGDWYHQLTEFPSALLDANGYISFQDSESYNDFLRDDHGIGVREVADGKEITIRTYISSHPAYRRFPQDGGPDGIADDDDYFEGAKTRVWVNRYEREPKARRDCLVKWGYDCQVCGFNFERMYGECGKDYIHVHHVVKISDVGKEYRVNGARDLRPVCPNCHAMLHQVDPPMSMEHLNYAFGFAEHRALVA